MSEPESKDLKEIKEYIAEIKSTFSMHYESFYREVDTIFKDIQTMSMAHTQNYSQLLSTLTNEQQMNQRLKTDRNELANVISQEVSELQQFEAENENVVVEIQSLKSTIANKKETVKELENECEILNKKIECQEQKRLYREQVYRELADKYRNVLEMEIVPIKQNVLKVILSKSYFIVNFCVENEIVSCFPLFMSLEELNHVYREKDNIYEFVKWIRKELIKWR